MKRILACLPGLTALFLVAGPWQYSAFSQSSPTPSGSPSPGGLVIVKTTTGSLGEYLTDSKGNSLYIFKADTADNSTCTGQCAQVWPPLVLPSGQPLQGGGDVKNDLLGTIQRADGTVQVTYDHQPLYTYITDTSPGMTTGQGITSFNAQWFLVKPDGTLVGASPSPSASASPAASATPPAGGPSGGVGSGSGGAAGA